MTDLERLKNHVRDLETRVAECERNNQFLQAEIDKLMAVKAIETNAPQFDLSDIKERNDNGI